VCAGLMGALLALGPAMARADDEETTPALRYREPQAKEHGRAVLGEIVVLGIGWGEYALDQKSNAQDWDLHYDWPSLKSKLVFDSISFDTNNFATNWITHQLAGRFYYDAARGNRLSIGESFLFTFTASTLWEYIGEWREQAAVNDLIATPVSGLAIGEPFFQLGAFFQRARPTVTTRGLSWFLEPMKNIGDAIDDAEPAPGEGWDALGLPTDVWHRFQVSLAGGMTKQDRGTTWPSARFTLGTRLVAFRDYGGEGEASKWFDAGEVSQIDFTMTATRSEISDYRFSSNALIAGHYERSVHGGVGHEVIGGWRVGYEYGGHDYDLDNRRKPDRIALVDTGFSVEHTLHLGSLKVRTNADLLVDFAGVDAYAMPEYAAAYGKDHVSSVLRNQLYYHAYGATVAPRVRLERGRFDAGGSLRADFFESIEALDREAPQGGATHARDRRIEMSASLGYAPSDVVHLAVSAERRDRHGSIGATSSARGETSLMGSLDFRF
jgi:hypothetical protein